MNGTCTKYALGGVILCPETTQDQKDRINITVTTMRRMEAINKGKEVDVEAFNRDVERCLPLMQWWNEEKLKAKTARLH